MYAMTMTTTKEKKDGDEWPLLYNLRLILFTLHNPFFFSGYMFSWSRKCLLPFWNYERDGIFGRRQPSVVWELGSEAKREWGLPN